jgi:hypothetical protein
MGHSKSFYTQGHNRISASSLQTYQPILLQLRDRQLHTVLSINREFCENRCCQGRIFLTGVSWKSVLSRPYFPYGSFVKIGAVKAVLSLREFRENRRCQGLFSLREFRESRCCQGRIFLTGVSWKSALSRPYFPYGSFVKIGAVKAVLFLRAYVKFKLRVNRRTVWHLESKERVSEIHALQTTFVHLVTLYSRFFFFFLWFLPLSFLHCPTARMSTDSPHS